MNELLITDTVRIAVENSSKPNFPVKYPGFTFEPPQDGRYIEIIHVPDIIPNQAWGPEIKTIQGLVRLLLHWPADGEGSIPPSTYLAEFEAYFAKGTKFRNANDEIKIYDHPTNKGIFPDGHDTFYMLSIPYHQYSKGV